MTEDLPMLEVKDASKKFGAHVVLQKITLSVEANTIIGLAGPSGGGKSTLLRAIQGLERLDSGIIEFKGKSGFMFQDFQLFPHMNVLSNLTYALKVRGDNKKNSEQEAQNLLTRLNIGNKAFNYPHQLSGGQKQRVALARSLMIHPHLLLCDEPTSGLDVATILEVVTLLKSVREVGMSMIIASHDLDFLTKIADRIILLKDGSISEDVDVKKLTDPIAYLIKYY